MADQRHLVPEPRNSAGREILEVTDKFGFDAYAAGWVHDRPTETWRYLLVTPMLKTKGPSWVYERLLKLFRHHPLPAGISPLDVFVIDPAMEISLFGTPMVTATVRSLDPTQPNGLNVMIAHEMRFDGFSVTDGFVSFYRRLRLEDRRRHRDPVTTFDHRVRHLQAA
jgi:hypothetical protein